MAKAPKTNAVRLVTAAGLPYRIHTYEFDPDDLAAQHVADALGQDIRRVFKTLVLRGDRTGLFVCVIPGCDEVDLKKAAAAAGDKKAELIHMKELLPLTGYVRGGCSPIGMKKPLPTFFHTTANDYDTIYVSAGQRGMQIEMNPAQLIDFVGAETADIVKN